jgi:hypothetical protein
MAGKVQLKVLVTSDTRDLVREVSQKRGCSQADLMEQALVAFLRPSDDGEPAQQDQLVEMVRDLQDMFLQFLTLLGAQPPPEAKPAQADRPPIATYEMMYGPIEPAGPAVAGAPAAPTPRMRPSRLRRWLTREERG